MTRIERTTIHPEVKPMPPEALEKMERLFGPTEPSMAQTAKDSFINGFAIGVISGTAALITTAITRTAALHPLKEWVGMQHLKKLFELQKIIKLPATN